jgi:hydroxymethylglutaryl-CoA synthase
MPGIRSYGAYIPSTRLPLAVIQGRPAKDGGPEKAVAWDDEDAVTMGVAAAVDCLAGLDRAGVDALLFASTSYTLREKQAAAVVAKALDLGRAVRTTDVSGSLRGGLDALETALHAVAAGGARNVLVVASDCRMGAPRGALEAKLGDGAAAFLVGTEAPIATLAGAHAVTDEMQDFWRIDGERFTHQWEDRFVVEEGFTPNVVAALRGVLEKVGWGAGDVAKVVVDGPDARTTGGVAKRAGIEPTRLQDPLFGRLGHAGAAFAPLLLVAALEGAKRGDRIVASAYGDGAQALAFEVTPVAEALPPRRGVRGHLDRRRPVTSYDAYLKARNLDAREWRAGADLGLSATIRFRERDADIAFVGAKCRRCGQVHFPKPRVCYECHAKDEWERYRLSDKRGRLLSYTFDYFFPAAQPPTIMTMTEVDGCRVQVQLVDARPEDATLDLPVEYVFRKIHDAGGKPNYFWKATPVREGA